MRFARKIAVAAVAVGIVMGTLAGGTAFASTNTSAGAAVVSPCGKPVCW